MSVVGERVLWRGKRSWKSVLGALVIGVLFLACVVIPVVGVVLAFIGIIILVAAALSVAGTEYVVTTHRVYGRYGVLRRTSFDVKLEWVTSSMLHQGIWGRILGYGNIIISAPGHLTGSVALGGVSGPQSVLTIINTAIENYKKRVEIEKELREIEREYTLGRITEEKYEEAKQKVEKELSKYM